MSVTHHPSDAVLVAYGAGSLGEGLALVVAGHLAFCPRCRDRIASIEAVGGALLEEIEPQAPEAAMDPGALDAMLARLDTLPADVPLPPPAAPVGLKLDFDVPPALRASLATPGADTAWRMAGPGVRQLVLHRPRHVGGPTAMLMRIAPGRKMPVHGHRGVEMTLVLDGGFSDEMGHFVAGDVAEVDPDTDHTPVADRGRDCICLVAVDAPIEFRGPILGPLQRLFGR